MMKKALKRFLAVSCTAALLLTTPGVEVLADEMQEEEVVLSDISETESVQEEFTEENIQEYDDEDHIDDLAENLEDQVPDISENVDVKDSEKIVIEEVEEEPVSEDVSSNSQADELEDNEALVGADYVESGTCGDSVYWGTTLNEDGETYTLTIYGQGEMLSYNYNSRVPWYNKSITDVIIESGVTSIGNWAFHDCYDLTSVMIPDSVTSIGDYAFSGCSKLTSITIPDSVTSIGDYAFSGCSNLTSVLMPSNIYSNYTAFDKCYSLVKVEGISKDGICWTLEKQDEGICRLTISGKGDMSNYRCVYLGGKYVSSSPWTLRGFEVTDIIIEKVVTNIGDYAFFRYGGLTSITISNSVSSIGSSAFSDCSSLTSITLPDSVASIGSSAFSGCSSLTSITIPDSVGSIGSSAFYNCSSLTSITIPDSVTSIGSSAFSGCSNLTSITLSNSVTSIESSAFMDCISLTSITIPDSVTSIGCDAFFRCSGLTSITIPDSVTWIDVYTFSGCSSLTSITIPDSVTWIQRFTFSGCSSLTSITIPDSVTRIGESAFEGCSRLPSITISGSVTSIGKSAFKDCSNLTSITIPADVTEIQEDTFKGCSSLTSITIPDSVTSIGSGTFRDCISLKSVTIPCRVYNLDAGIFEGCTSLETVILNGTYTTIKEDSFKDLPTLKEIIILAPIQEIGSYAFTSCPNLQSIRLPISLSKVGIGAFRYDTALETVYYNGSESQWDNISIANYNEPLLNANLVNSNDISWATINTESESYVYTGTLVNPSPIVTLDGKTLVKGTDYDLTYENDLNVGTATVIAHGKGAYTGTVSCTYGITPRDIGEGTASTKSKTYAFNGKPRHPAMILVVNNITLVQDVDYTLDYENNIEIGTAKAIAHGIGNYTGEISCTFEIIHDGPVSIETAEIHTKSESYVYTGTPRNPSPIITLDGKTLVKGTDYDLTYENDLNVGTATVIAHGKGAYTGTVSCTYGITPRDIGEGTASTKSKTYAYEGKPRHPAMILVVNNRTLVKDVDYTLTYENDTEVGTATVTAHGIGNYVGEKSCTYGIVIVKPTTIQYAQITTKSPSYVYTGTPRNPSPIITLGGKTLVKGTDYDLSYKNDVNVGTATVTATGKGDYKGTISCN